MKRNPVYYLRNLMLVERNKEWLTSDIRLSNKALYYPLIWKSYMRLVVGGRRSVRYLGRNVIFDNVATPLNLQNYPYEITRKILANMHFRPTKVLDIGGNIGQFSLTMQHVLGPRAKIDIFEPNKQVFELLATNIAGIAGVRAFNYALGEKKHRTKMYFESGRSGTGSIIKENASDSPQVLNEVQIEMVDTVVPLTKRRDYDLVKIDVEGFELHALKALKDIKTAYIFLEVSSGRTKDYSHSELFAVINKQFGAFDIVYASSISKDIATFDILIRLKNVRS